LHWFLTGHPAETKAAEQDLMKLYPQVPVGYPDGANNTESTYLHLLVCQLEQQADRAVLGEQRTGQVMQFWAADHYRWVYRTVLQDEAKIEDILKRNHLDTPDARRPHQTHEYSRVRFEGWAKIVPQHQLMSPPDPAVIQRSPLEFGRYTVIAVHSESSKAQREDAHPGKSSIPRSHPETSQRA
jgi:hypothetical protein